MELILQNVHRRTAYCDNRNLIFDAIYPDTLKSRSLSLLVALTAHKRLAAMDKYGYLAKFFFHQSTTDKPSLFYSNLKAKISSSMLS